ncbi:hypothetical protein PMAYCL1PPCAC_04069, partial [Pristionchus mayeri]
MTIFKLSSHRSPFNDRIANEFVQHSLKWKKLQSFIVSMPEDVAEDNVDTDYARNGYNVAFYEYWREHNALCIEHN